MRKRVLALVLVTAAACSTGAQDEDSMEATSSPSPSITETPSPAPTKTVTPSEEAAAHVLTLGDVGGSGWKKDQDANPEGAPGQRSTKPECSYQLAALSPGNALARAATGFVFENSDPSDAVSSLAYVYATEGEADRALRALSVRAKGCRAWRSGGVEGGPYAFMEKQHLFTATGLPPGSLGVQTDTSSPAFPEVPPTHACRVAARTGNVLIVVEFTSLRMLESVAQKEALRLARVALA